MSQISFLFWQQGHLFIDPSVSASSKNDLYQLLSPDEIVQDLPEEPDAAILMMGLLDSSTVLISEAVDSHFVNLDEDSYQSDAIQAQQTFQEGRRRLINHYRVERNRRLRMSSF